MLTGTLQSISPYSDPRVIAVHLSVVVMLGTGFILRRSLGSWPCWLASFIYVTVVEAIWIGQGMPREAGLPSVFEMLFLPTVILVLARRQIIPGLRRGELTEQDRRRWIAQRGFAGMPQGREVRLARIY